MNPPPTWFLPEDAGEVQRARLTKLWNELHRERRTGSRAIRTIEANNLWVGQVCVDILKGSR